MENLLGAVNIKQTYGIGFFLVLGIGAFLLSCLFIIFGTVTLWKGEIAVIGKRRIKGTVSRLLSSVYILSGWFFLCSGIDEGRLGDLLFWISIVGFIFSIASTIILSFSKN